MRLYIKNKTDIYFIPFAILLCSMFLISCSSQSGDGTSTELASGVDTSADNSITPNAVLSTPTIEISSPSTTITPGTAITLTGTVNNPDYSRLRFIWGFDGVTPNDAESTDKSSVKTDAITFNDIGKFEISLRVVELANPTNRSAGSIEIIVENSTNPAPSPTPSPTPDLNDQTIAATISSPSSSSLTLQRKDEITFTGTITDPGNNGPYTYYWNFAGVTRNATLTSSNKSITTQSVEFNKAGNYTIFLRVADKTGTISSITDQIAILVTNAPSPAPNPPPGNGNAGNNTTALLSALEHPKFVNALPIPRVLRPNRNRFPGFEFYDIEMSQFTQDLGLVDPQTGRSLRTTVWGYDESYPGPTIESRSTSPKNVVNPGTPVKVRWSNDLPNTHLLPLDTTLRCGPQAFGCRPEVRTVTHLHGGHTDAGSDGHPEAWFSPGFAQSGPTFDRSLRGVYTYRNDQEAASLWYHDHAMAITRLNVYAGLAGFYLIRDDNEDRLVRENFLPQPSYEIPMVIQDRSFYADGSLFYPDDPFVDPVSGQPLTLDPLTGQPSPSVVPEFFGDFVLVNGKAWPVLEVEPRKYRLRVLNGSNSRFYDMNFSWQKPQGQTTNLKFFQIGTDGGLLDDAVETQSLLLAPAERADVVIDFSESSLQGGTIILTNRANSPFPFGDPIDAQTTGKIMAFKVVKPLNIYIPDSRQPETLRSQKMPRLQATPGVPARELVLVEGTDELGRLQPALGTAATGGLLWSDPVTETPKLNTTEIWTIINATPDAHPVHQHLVQFQILDRQKFSGTYVPGQPVRLSGPRTRPNNQEAGWKDTVRANPAEVLRIIAHYDLPGEYVWHCHILEHEDHEMMRPFRVVN